jgi:transcriptional regulator GlxA family with amidase domain
MADACDIPANSAVERARRLVVATSSRPLYVHHLAEETGLTPKTLGRRMRATIGMTPVRLRTHLRLQRAIRFLWSEPRMTVAEVATAVGFEDAREFRRVLRSTFGLTPAELGRRRASAASEESCRSLVVS